jgi:phage portal protein BeeE
MTRLIDRLLSRQAGYNEAMYSGAYAVSVSDPSGRGKEGAPAGGVRHAREALAGNGIVFACIAARMSLFSEARLVWQSTADKHVYTDQDLALFQYPWPNATTGELLARLEQDVSTAGNCYLRKVNPADGGDPLLVQMRPDCVTIVSEEKRDDAGRIYKMPVGYSEDLVPLGITDRDPQFYSTDEVAHYSPFPDPMAFFRGMSWLTPVLREVGADNGLTEYKTAHVARGAMPGMVVKYSQKLSQPVVDRLKKRFEAMYSGAGNAGRTLVLDEGADVTVAGSTLEQLQYTAVQAAGETRILAAAMVPTEVIGVEGPRSASGNYELAIRRFADLWARPHWRSACAALQHLVPGVVVPTRLWYDVSDIAALREGELARSQATLVRAQAVAAFVAAGYTRQSAIAAAESGDLSQLAPDPAAPPAGVSGRETATTSDRIDGRPPQAGVPQDLPGVVKPNLPNALPFTKPPMPALPNGARG